MNQVRAFASAALAVLLLAACDGGPSDAELQAASEEAEALVIEVSNDLVDALREGNPDLMFDVQGRVGGPALSWDCSDGPASDADAIQWAVDRQVEVDPRQPVDELLDPLIDILVDDGWALVQDEMKDVVRSVDLTRDGFHVDMSADHTLSGDDPVWVTLSTYSSCLEAPSS